MVLCPRYQPSEHRRGAIAKMTFHILRLVQRRRSTLSKLSKRLQRTPCYRKQKSRCTMISPTRSSSMITSNSQRTMAARVKICSFLFLFDVVLSCHLLCQQTACMFCINHERRRYLGSWYAIRLCPLACSAGQSKWIDL